MNPKVFYVSLCMNTSYFEDINTAEKAYLLGFLYADGSITQPKGNRQMRLSCYQHIRAREVIEKLRNVIREDDKGLCELTTRPQIAFHLSSDKICNDLISLGMLPNKSTGDYPMPDIPYKWDFIRGFFDGDGTVGKYGNNRIVSYVSHSKKLLEDIQKEYIKEGIRCTLYAEKSYWRLRTTYIKGIQQIYSNFYDDGGFCIEYKKKRFKETKGIPR